MAFTREQIEEELFYILSESLELIVEIEKRFSYVCEPEELELSIFDNFNTLVDFVLSKKQLN